MCVLCPFGGTNTYKSLYLDTPWNGDLSVVCGLPLVTPWKVGYGDIVPITPAGRALGSVVAFAGVGLFGLPAGSVAIGKA